MDDENNFSERIVSNMTYVCIMDDENNFSDHRALCFQFKASCNSQFESVEGKSHVVNWDVNVLKSYYAANKDKLFEITEPNVKTMSFVVTVPIVRTLMNIAMILYTSS